MDNQVFTPDPEEIKAIVVVDFYGRTQTYGSLLSAITAVHQLPPVVAQKIEAAIKGVKDIKGD